VVRSNFLTGPAAPIIGEAAARLDKSVSANPGARLNTQAARMP
jgi:hypothetical protein